MPEYPKLESRIPLANDITVKVVETTASATVTVVVADTGGCYLTNSTTTASSFLRAFQSALTNNATLAGTYAVGISDGNATATGKVTISVTGVDSFSLVWSSTSYGSLARTIMGFSTDLNIGSASYTGANASPYIWLPDVGRTEPMGPDALVSNQYPAQDSDLVVVEAPSGASYAYSYGRRGRERMAFRYLTANKVHILNESTTNESLQKFWQIMLDDSGMVFRLAPDRSVDTITVDYRAMWPSFRAEPTEPGWTGSKSKWAVFWDAIEKV